MNALPDNDGDSLPDPWEQRHFLSRLTCVPGEDSDGDGLSNEGEFVAGDWPQYGGPNRNHISDEKGWLVHWPPKLEWSYSVAVAGGSLSTDDPITLCNATAFTGSGGRRLVALHHGIFDVLTGAGVTGEGVVDPGDPPPWLFNRPRTFDFLSLGAGRSLNNELAYYTGREPSP